MADDQTIVIKKINKGGHAPHGGAWKVAYADFVTAMMAFFLLLWLLNATEAEKLAGLADYFAPTVGVQGNMGIGFRGGKGALSKGIGADKSTNKGIIFAAPTAGTVIRNPEIVENENTLPEEEKIRIAEDVPEEISEEEIAQEEAFKEVEDEINKEFSQDGLDDLRGNVFIQSEPEGLKIQIVEREKRPMFLRDSPDLTADAKKILKKVSKIISLLPNYVSITGHTDSLPLGKGIRYTNWELSVDRANTTRRFLIESGVVKEQISRVVGKADHLPLNPQSPEAEENNRIDIILLRNAFLTFHKKNAPEEVFVDPELADREDLISVDPKPVPLEEVPQPDTVGRDLTETVESEEFRESIGEKPEEEELLADPEDKQKFFEEDLLELPAEDNNNEELLNDDNQGSPFPIDFFGDFGF